MCGDRRRAHQRAVVFERWVPAVAPVIVILTVAGLIDATAISTGPSGDGDRRARPAQHDGRRSDADAGGEDLFQRVAPRRS